VEPPRDVFGIRWFADPSPEPGAPASVLSWTLDLDLDAELSNLVGQRDMVSGQVFAPGAPIYYCHACMLGFHADSWEYLGAVCAQCQEADRVGRYVLGTTVRPWHVAWRTQFAIAGWRFHRGDSVLPWLSAGRALELRPEPENPHDPHAVAVWAEGVKLGYVPRQLAPRVGELWRGGRLTATVGSIDPEAPPWLRCFVRCEEHDDAPATW
jgi:hypothetical protein